jgi:exopolysaccharide biosynthesis polyprenyl glycosylphosphotransferase
MSGISPSQPTKLLQPIPPTVSPVSRKPGAARKTQFAQSILRALLPVVDMLALALAFVMGYYARRHFPLVPQELAPPPIKEGFGIWSPTMAVHIVTLIGIFFFARLYHQRRALSRIDQISTVFAAVSVGVVMTSGFSTFLFKNSIFDINYPRQLVLYVWLFTLLWVIVGREFHRQIVTRLRQAGQACDNVLIVGSGEAAQTVIQQIQSRPELGYRIVGAVNGQVGTTITVRENGASIPVIGTIEQLPTLIDSQRISEVIIALPEASHIELTRLIGLCQRGRVSIKLYPDLFAYMAGGISVDELGTLPLLSVRDMPMRGWKLTLKRGLDVFGSVAGLIALSPLMLFTAVIIRLESPGPVFFCQERTGLDGRPFPMIKFRTMRQDSEAKGPGWTVKGDSRVTKSGKWMRANNWDEIPNLINVLLGQMSLVGPRPEQTVYVEKFRENIPRYMERHREKAGMTGWAQVNGYRGDTSIVERTKYDLYYVENWSLWFDIKVIIRTIVQTLLRRNKNAY